MLMLNGLVAALTEELPLLLCLRSTFRLPQLADKPLLFLTQTTHTHSQHPHGPLHPCPNNHRHNNCRGNNETNNNSGGIIMVRWEKRRRWRRTYISGVSYLRTKSFTWNTNLRGLGSPLKDLSPDIKYVPSKSLTSPNLTPIKVSMVQMDALIERQIAVVLQWYYWKQLSIVK